MIPLLGTAPGGGHELLHRIHHLHRNSSSYKPRGSYEHHKDSIHWYYRCFDRHSAQRVDLAIAAAGAPDRVVGFFNTYLQLYPVTRYTLHDIADQFQRWVKERAAKRNILIVEAPKGRRAA